MDFRPHSRRAINERLFLVTVSAATVLALSLPAAAQSDESSDTKKQAPPAKTVPMDAEKKARAALEAQARQLEEMAQRLQQVERAYREALERQAREMKMADAERTRRLAEEARNLSAPNKEAQMQRMHQELEKSRAQLAEMAAMHQKMKAVALPENAHMRIFNLRNLPAPAVAETISAITGGQGMRLAVDERSNSIIVFGDEKIIDLVDKVVMQLGETAKSSEGPVETLQLRIVWLLDIEEGVEPNEKLVSPQVVDALHELGFEHPKVVCQQVTTLTLGAENRKGRFQFEVPVLIQSQPWQFEGQGEIEPMSDERLSLQFKLGFWMMRPEPSGRARGPQAQLGGSIYTPLGHYTVMGTTTFVGEAPAPLPEDRQPGDFGTGGVIQKQHLSAFVVYLDRAREFPAAGGESKDQVDVHP